MNLSRSLLHLVFRVWFVIDYPAPTLTEVAALWQDRGRRSCVPSISPLLPGTDLTSCHTRFCHVQPLHCTHFSEEQEGRDWSHLSYLTCELVTCWLQKVGSILGTLFTPAFQSSARQENRAVESYRNKSS